MKGCESKYMQECAQIKDVKVSLNKSTYTLRMYIQEYVYIRVCMYTYKSIHILGRVCVDGVLDIFE